MLLRTIINKTQMKKCFANQKPHLNSDRLKMRKVISLATDTQIK